MSETSREPQLCFPKHDAAWLKRFTEKYGEGRIYLLDFDCEGKTEGRTTRVVKIRDLCLRCECVRAVFANMGGGDDVYDLEHFDEMVVREITDRKPGQYAF